MNYFVHSKGCETEVQERLGEAIAAASLQVVELEDFLRSKDTTEEDRVVIYGSSDEIKRLLEHSFVYGFSIGIVPRASQRYLQQTYELPADPVEALQIALDGKSGSLDLLYCNDEIVLWSALVGEAPPHGKMASLHYEAGGGSRVLLLLRNIGRIFRLRRAVVKLRTFKEQQIATALSGIVIVAHDDHSCASKLLANFFANSRGKIAALLLSPSSVVAYIGYLYKALFAPSGKLPKAVGVVMSERLEIESQPSLPVQIDGKPLCATPVTFEMHKKAVRFVASERFWEKESLRQSDEKEVVKLGALPTDPGELEYSQKHIPFFPHADTSKYQELFTSLREEARTGATYITMMILSTLLATTGLFLNSASVIIGAMLLAPLMQPIVSFSMGLLRFDMDLLMHGSRSVFVGVAIALGMSMLLAWGLPFQMVTAEMAGRLHPTLLDLLVAIISGIAAAYAKNNPRISGSLVGVSIAVALVPPIATAGIGLGWHEWEIFQNAFLLFLTNFAGIVFAAAVTFMVLGFSPIKRARKGLIISTMTLLAISVPLYFTFSLMVHDARIKEVLHTKPLQIEGHRVVLENIEIRHSAHGKNLEIRSDTVSDFHFGEGARHALKSAIYERVKPYLRRGEKLSLEVIERYRY